ncbi:MAG: tRNA pseudouridine(13) synthase TruD, partial [Legionella sp.]
MYTLDWPYAYGKPLSTATFKASPEDFQVNELFTGEFSGEGEHILLKIEKKGLNTEDVVKALARLINKSIKTISYAGLKDRQALSTQWLSIHAPGEDIAGLEDISEPNWRVLEHSRHNKKLRPGFLTGNQFIIQLKQLSEPEAFIQRIEQIKARGVPNYFGEQRFGRNAGNLEKAEALLVQGKRVKDRFLQGIYFSAARSWIFNLILAERVRAGNWCSVLAGDVMQLSGSHSIFVAENDLIELDQRILAKDLSPAGPLPGKRKNMVQG